MESRIFTRVRKRPVAIAAASGLALAGLVGIPAAMAGDSPPYVISATNFSIDVADQAAYPNAFLDDEQGSLKELGPLNGNSTKLGVIHAATVPMLALTNPNAQVDLRGAWIDTRPDGDEDGDDDQWLYFAWERDSSNGSGVIMFEFQQDQAPLACDYDGTDQSLIDGCNPWVNRKNGDFILVWDQQGTTINILKRVFDGTKFGDSVDLESAVAVTSADGFFGEAAINLTQDVFGGTPECTAFANVIPGTVTGNSDTADYKDTILADAPTISNCGRVEITKDAAGDTVTPFSWTLARTGDQELRFRKDFPLPASLTEVTESIVGGETDPVEELIAGTNYTLVEDSPLPGGFELTSIVCEVDANGNGAIGTGESFPITGDDTFPVVVGKTTYCTIENDLQDGTLRVIKELTNDNGGTQPLGDFDFSRNDGSGAVQETFEGTEINGTDSQDFTYPANTTVDVLETDYSPAYATTYSDDYAGNDPEEGEDPTECRGLVVPAGGVVTCTIANDDNPGVLIVEKYVINDNGDDKTAGRFSFTVDGGTAIPFDEDDSDELFASNTIDPIDAGIHTVLETGTNGYAVTYGGDCNASGSVTVLNGQTSTCTVTNDDAAGSSAVLTAQSRILRDSASVTMRTGPGGGASTVKFSVFDSLEDCQAYLDPPEGEDPAEPLWTTTAEVTEGSGQGTADTFDAEHGGYLAPAPGTYLWLAEFSGNNFNEPSRSNCGSEITVLNFTDDGDLPE